MFSDPYYGHFIIAVIIVAAFVVLGQLLRKFLTSVVGMILRLTNTTLDDRILEVVRARVMVLCIIAGMYAGMREIRKGLTAEHVTHLQILEYLDVALYFLTVFVLIRLTGRIITTILSWYMDEVSSKTRSNITPTVIPMASKIVNLIVVLIATVIVLDHFGVNIGSLLVSLGVGSLAVALAAQETVANMISGFVILIDQPFRVGDRIRLPSGEEGDVQAIGLRSTRILNYENNLIVVPNSELVKNRVINFSFPNPSMRVMVDVGVAYGTDINKARTIMLSVAARFPEIAADPPPEVHLVQLGDSSLQLRFLGRAQDFGGRWIVENAIREEIYNAFRNSGIEIPFPQRVVRVINADESQAHQK